MHHIIDPFAKYCLSDPVRRAYLRTAVLYLWKARLELLFRSTQALIDDVRTSSMRSDRLTLCGPSGVQPDIAAWALQVVAPRLPWRADCLVQSIAAMRWLADGGLQPSFHIGAALSSTNSLTAHAWVELEGVPVAEGGAERFAEFAFSNPHGSSL